MFGISWIILLSCSSLGANLVNVNALQRTFHLISLPAATTTTAATTSIVRDSSEGIRNNGISVPTTRALALSQEQQQAVRDIWRWKDATLGDGRDFFVPRPRAISALTSLLKGQTFPAQAQLSDDEETSPTDNNAKTAASSYYIIDECAVLSNCARFDVYLSCSPLQDKDNVAALEGTDDPSFSSSSHIVHSFDNPRAIVASVLASQLQHYHTKRKSPGYILSSQMSSILDLPGMVVVEHENGKTSEPGDDALAVAVQESLLECSDLTEIIRYTCLVTSGMAPRTNRPDRPVEFRPFSSRDAHIMLQMKRTLDVAQGAHIQAILKASLSAGKAARDVSQVPEIKALQKSGGGDTPAATIQQATEAALQKAIEPNVQKCVSELQVRKRSITDKVISLRRKSQSMVESMGGDWSGTEGSMVKQYLHQPTMDLRNGILVDEQAFLQKVHQLLKEFHNEKEIGLSSTINRTQQSNSTEDTREHAIVL
jgi:hypothetical protein